MVPGKRCLQLSGRAFRCGAWQGQGRVPSPGLGRAATSVGGPVRTSLWCQRDNMYRTPASPRCGGGRATLTLSAAGFTPVRRAPPSMGRGRATGHACMTRAGFLRRCWRAQDAMEPNPAAECRCPVAHRSQENRMHQIHLPNDPLMADGQVDNAWAEPKVPRVPRSVLSMSVTRSASRRVGIRSCSGLRNGAPKE